MPSGLSTPVELKKAEKVASATPSKRTSAPHGGRKTAISDFFIGCLLGEGAYARVHTCKLKSSGEYFALKVMEKRFILKEQARRRVAETRRRLLARRTSADSPPFSAPPASLSPSPPPLHPCANLPLQKTDFVIMEKKVLSQFEHRNVMRLYYSFHDRKHLYMVMDLCRGGELLRVISHYSDLESAASVRLPCTKSALPKRAHLSYFLFVDRCVILAVERRRGYAINAPSHDNNGYELLTKRTEAA